MLRHGLLLLLDYLGLVVVLMLSDVDLRLGKLFGLLHTLLLSFTFFLVNLLLVHGWLLSRWSGS